MFHLIAHALFEATRISVHTTSPAARDWRKDNNHFKALNITSRHAQPAGKKPDDKPAVTSNRR